jgi:hypothetical protein
LEIKALKFNTMKKLLLLLLIPLMTEIVRGQLNVNYTEKMPVQTLDPMGGNGQQVVIGQILTESIVGTTWYDLQTYGAMPHRIYAYPDGTVGVVWMMGFETTAWSDRGTGYNYFDGSDWGTYPTEKLESIRTGWPCYAPLGPNGEVVASHAQSSDDWVILINKRTNKGTGEWQESSLAGPTSGIGIVWPAMVTNGPDHNTIHLLVRSYNADNLPYMGQNGALLYSRSTDGGATWDIQNHFFEELGPDYFVNIDADGYAWAEPRGNTLAFSVGFDSGPACIMKSTDNGDSWEFIPAYESPYYPPPSGATLPFGAGDGTQAVAIDNNGIVHVVYGRMRYVYDDTGAQLYYPATDGLIYWNETMPVMDSTLISSFTLDSLIAHGNLAGWVIDPGIGGLSEFPSYYTSLTSHPQMIIDENNRIFVIYSGAAPTYNNGTWNYRHIYGNSSSDGGATWNGIVDINSELVYIFAECVYPAMSPVLQGGQFHFWFQNDPEPGIFVWATQQPAAGENNITYMAHETFFLTGIKDNTVTNNNGLNVSQNFPNPFNAETFIDVTVDQPGQISFVVSDVARRIVHAEDFGKAAITKLRIRFENTNLPAGIYYYTVTSAAGSFTGKMLVK